MRLWKTDRVSYYSIRQVEQKAKEKTEQEINEIFGSKESEASTSSNEIITTEQDVLSEKSLQSKNELEDFRNTNFSKFKEESSASISSGDIDFSEKEQSKKYHK